MAADYLKTFRKAILRDGQRHNDITTKAGFGVPLAPDLLSLKSFGRSPSPENDVLERSSVKNTSGTSDPLSKRQESEVIGQKAHDEGLRHNDHNDQRSLFRTLSRVFAVLERRCPEHIDVDRWQQAVEDGRRFVASWGERAESLGWTAKELFGLHTPPEKPHPSYSRLSRYDETGLIWLLTGKVVTELTETTATIEYKTGTKAIYRIDKSRRWGQ
jgi:hypothetical protein